MPSWVAVFFRWCLVPLAAWASWSAAILIGYAMFVGLESLCPSSSFVSGHCTAPWFMVASRMVFVLGAALAASLVVVSSTLAAPSHRRVVALVTFATGAMVALFMAIAAKAWLECAAALLAGLVCAAWLRRRASGAPQ